MSYILIYFRSSVSSFEQSFVEFVRGTEDTAESPDEDYDQIQDPFPQSQTK